MMASLAIAVCGVLFMALPVPGPDVNWLLSAPVCLAMAVLGRRWRSMVSVVAALALGCLPGLLGAAMGSEPLLAVAPSVQACAMCWCIGSMVGMAGDAERAKSVGAERSRQREHRLRMLGMLHDSLANDLVAAMLRCRAISARQGVDTAVLAEIREVEDILERSVVRLREDILIPERAALGEGSAGPGQRDVTGRGAVPGADPASRLTATAAELDRWLKSREWEGLVRVTGDFLDVDVAVVRLVERCVRELGMNMLKYGSPGAFALEADADGDCVRVLSSDPIGRDAGGRGADGCDSGLGSNGCDGGSNAPDPRLEFGLSSDCGLALLRRELERCGGSLQWASEAGEWMCFVKLLSADMACLVVRLSGWF
jgi:hypothetical protein